jgi:transposase
MQRYSTEHRKCILEEYFKSGSYRDAKQILAQRFPAAHSPSKSTILRLVQKFRKTGSVRDNLKNPGTPRVLTGQKMTEIQGEIFQNPHISLRRLSQKVDVSYETARKALRRHLGMFPYKVTCVHELLAPDFEHRLFFCDWLIEVTDHDPNFLDNCFFSDESWFHLNGYVNSQNMRLWSGENLHPTIQKTLHSQKLGVWAAMSAKRIVVVFFDTTVNGEVYRGFIDQFVGTMTEDEILSAWFQQDGATAHTAKVTLQHLENYFGQRVITRGLWPARSPDLTPPDFFLWGYLKGMVYADSPKTIAHLKANILNAISAIPLNILSDVSQSVVRRARLCTAVGGGHFQNL